MSEIGLGSGLFGASADPRGDRSHAKLVFDAYAGEGGRFIDTAEGYQAGQSEELVGEFVGRDRDEFVIASKFSIGRARSENYTLKGNSRKAMMTAVEGSLRRLKTDYIDLYWLHAHDAMTPMEEILRGYDDLIRSGKIRYCGLSNFPAWRVAYGVALAADRRLAPITAVSYEYSLAERSAEREILPMAEALGLGVGLWSPLGGGFLARENRPDGLAPSSHLAHWRGLGRPTDSDVKVQSVLRHVARRIGVSAARVAHAWILTQARRYATGIIPIVGVSSVEQVKDTLAAAVLELDASTLLELEAASRIQLGEPHDHNEFHREMTDGGPHYSPPYTVA